MDKGLVKLTRKLYDEAYKGNLNSLVWIEMSNDGCVAHGIHLSDDFDQDKLQEAAISLFKTLSGGQDD